MSYEIGYARMGRSNISVAQSPNAHEALKTVLALQASDEEIRHIKAPAGHDIGLANWRCWLSKRDTVMPKGPRGEKRPADVIGAAVKVMRIATGEEEEVLPAKKSAAGEICSE